MMRLRLLFNLRTVLQIRQLVRDLDSNTLRQRLERLERSLNLSQVFAGQSVGVTQVGERIWLVTFMQYDLWYFDDETCRLEPIENPFGPKLLPIRSE